MKPPGSSSFQIDHAVNDHVHVQGRIQTVHNNPTIATCSRATALTAIAPGKIGCWSAQRFKIAGAVLTGLGGNRAVADRAHDKERFGADGVLCAWLHATASPACRRQYSGSGFPLRISIYSLWKSMKLYVQSLSSIYFANLFDMSPCK